MTRPDEIAALADEDELADFIYQVQDYSHAKRKAAVLWPLVRLSATSPGDAVRGAKLMSAGLDKALEALDAISANHIPDCPPHYTGDELAWAQRYVADLRRKAELTANGIRAALAPAEKAGDDEGFGSVRGKLDHLGRRVDSVDMPQALKDSIARCYGLLRMLETEDKRAHRARRGLLSWLTKDEQVWGIENAKAICLMNGLDDGSSQKDCPGTSTATPTPPSADVAAKIMAAIAPCKGEQYKFEEWAKSRHYDMSEHPLHYLFLDPKTNGARNGWKAALEYVERIIQSAAPGGGTESKCDCGPTCKDVGPECRYIKSDGAAPQPQPQSVALASVEANAANAPSDPAQEPSVTTFGGSSPCLGRPGDARNTYVDAQEPQAVAHVSRQTIERLKTHSAANALLLTKPDPTTVPLYTRPVSLDREALIAHLNDARGNFAKISGDWTDPRDWCDEGCKAINSALALIEGMA